MVDFKIRRGLSTTLFIEPGVVNPRLVIEEGCWYLCTDTAELFLGVLKNEELILKKINQTEVVNQPSHAPSTGEGEADRGVIGAYIDETTGELYLVFSDNTEESLGPVVGDPGKDGLVTSIKIGETVYEHTNGFIELPEFATQTYVDKKIAAIENPALNITILYGGDANPDDDEE
jgi:hypothetical protein